MQHNFDKETMIQLPEIETIRRDLERDCVGKKIKTIEVIKSKHTNADAIYSKAQMRWSLSKDIEEQERLNIKNTLEVEKTFPQIRMKIYNFVEFGKES